MNEAKLENSRWIGKNYELLVKKYNRKWIAVIDKQVVAYGNSLGKLRKEIEKKFGTKAREAAFEWICDIKVPPWGE